MDGEKIKAGFNSIGNGIMPASKVLAGRENIVPLGEVKQSRMIYLVPVQGEPHLTGRTQAIAK